MNSKTTPPIGDTSLTAIVITALFIILLVFGFYFFNFNGKIGSQELFGQFGDFVGGILNPILSFITIILLMKSLMVQRIELNKVAEELELTRQVHRTEVNMRHYEYLIERLLKEESDFRGAISMIPYLMDEVIELRSPSDKIKGEYRFMDIIHSSELLSVAERVGYVVRVRNNPTDITYVSMPISDKFDALNAQFITLLNWISQLEELECPVWRAIDVLHYGEDILQDYYISCSEPYKNNLSRCCPNFKAFKDSLLHYKHI